MSLLQTAQQIQEAFCIRRGIPVARQFSDEQLAESHTNLAEAELELYGRMTRDEQFGRLAPEEQALLDELNRRLIPFRVTVTMADRTEQLSVLASDACMATVRVFEVIFGDFDSEKPQSFKLKVEAIRRREVQPCAA